jgi:hypothetical protein
MTRRQDKNRERHYVEFCARCIGETWTVVDEGEAPDFVLSDGKDTFGLEVTRAFTDSAQGRRGSEVRRREGMAQKSLDRIRRAYLERTGATISVTLAQRPRAAEEAEIVNGLVALGLQDQPIGAVDEFRQRDGTRGIARRTPSQVWRIVSDSAGWVDRQGQVQLQRCIAQKAPAVRFYRPGLADLRLLVVADSMLNSGKLRVDEGAAIDLMGFTHVYFAAYPLEVQTFPRA